MKNRFKNRLKDRTLMFGDVRRMPASPADQANGILGVRIEYDYKDDPKALAMRLGELYIDQSTFEKEAKQFAVQAEGERTKAIELQGVLAQIEHDPSRKSLVVINPATGLPRRMNPYQEYSIDALIEQRLTHERRGQEFDDIAFEKRAALTEAREEMGDVEKALEQLKEK